MSTALATLEPVYEPVKLRTLEGGKSPAKRPREITIKRAPNPVRALNGVLPKPAPVGRHWAIIDSSWDYSKTQADIEVIGRAEQLPDARNWSRALALAIVETLSGQKYPSALERFVSPDLYEAIERKVALAARLDGPAGRSPRTKALSSRVCLVNESIAETTHVVVKGETTRAVAIRLEARRRQWVATALEIL
ncbi:Rv3235 family protein [uncultured Actinomyces sp.]|uniref:Rv3235 family protein n=1 Tax=uncultured Actinomyces sp. TaxID=249061 RepID=UPI002618868B|nr:Rv3235 family protein [uncultured Actinomyces sp.]